MATDCLLPGNLAVTNTAKAKVLGGPLSLEALTAELRACSCSALTAAQSQGKQAEPGLLHHRQSLDYYSDTGMWDMDLFSLWT